MEIQCGSESTTDLKKQMQRMEMMEDECNRNRKGEVSVEEGYRENKIKKARLQSTLVALVDDPILSDVPKNPTLSDVDTLICLELGSAMRISVLKLDATAFGTLQTISQFQFLVFFLFVHHKILEFEADFGLISYAD